MPEPLTKDDMKQAAKDAAKEFLKEQMSQFQKGVGAFVIRWISVALVLGVFHAAFHGKYQKMADYLVEMMK